jgi:3-phenylpropionate/trans-cinnamate dioxygenase ferredoxin reductase subunit
VCVIGGGYIGLEVASALQTIGKQVTVIHRERHVLSRSVPPILSGHVAQAHRRRGVDLRTGRHALGLRQSAGAVAAVHLADGTDVECDMVVLGTGVVPNTRLAAQAGLRISNGIDTDACGRTSAPNIVSAGDVACMALPARPGLPSRMRLESIQAANDGGRAAGATVAGLLQPCSAVPWFWSDQFDLKLQMAGIAVPGDETVVRGDMDGDRFSVGYVRGGVLAAMHSVNRPAEHMLARKLIAAQVRIAPQQLADPSFDLKAALAQQAQHATA